MLANDAHAMAYGEYLADGRTRTVRVVKVATGIGAGLVMCGRPHSGDSHGAGQFGHMRVPGLTEVCPCGQAGCLATVASGRALLRRLRGRGVRTLEDITARSEVGEAETVRALAEAGDAVGTPLSGVATMLDPGLILFGGRLGHLPPFLEAAKAAIGSLTYSRTARHIQVGPTVLGATSAATGLAALVVDTELAPAAVDRLVARSSARERRVAASRV